MQVETRLSRFLDAYDAGERTFRDLTLLVTAMRGRSFTECAFEASTFEGVELLDVTFVRCTFNATTFSQARLHEGVAFSGCKFYDVAFDSAEFRAGVFRACTFEVTHFTKATLRNVKFFSCHFSDSADAAVSQWWLTAENAYAPRRSSGALTFADTQMEGALFDSCAFEGASLTRSRLREVNLSKCRLSGVRASHMRGEGIVCEMTDFISTSFDNAVLAAASFTECTFRHIRYVAAELDGVSFQSCVMEDADVSRARLLASDLAPFCESRLTLRLSDPPVIDWRSVCKSLRSQALPLLLLDCGMPDIMVQYLIDAARAVDPAMLFKMMRSTFISYGEPDREFAAALRAALEQNGVRTFFFDADAIPGERLHRVMHEGVNRYDRVIVICSEYSLSRTGVRNEIEETLAREARDGGASYLIPITRDRFVFEWDDVLGLRLRDRVVADFSKAPPGSVEFRSALQRLLRALRVEPSESSGA